MTTPNRTYSINFNVVLDDETNRQLQALATDLSVSKAHVCRSSISTRYNMHFRRSPHCADLQDCRCPHAFVYPPSPGPPEAPNDTSPPP